MASEQFSQAVRGSSAEPVNVGQTGSIETNDYDNGDGFQHDGSSYPYSHNPAGTIQELILTEAGDIDMEVTTVGGDTFSLRLAGSTGVFNRWNIDSVTFRDPRGTAAPVYGGWAGE
ncbi:hypothetical protein [Haloarcula salina]|uniref:Uncharacterized protein n=1 Tax=Haloarcula salina TaxID=1429914 RepID=A0AA41G411_9EURY|nr:hypothetical protein [Haloarcula salina]MBV0903917.1 hypothetical protein [Haloarcula salina]